MTDCICIATGPVAYTATKRTSTRIERVRTSCTCRELPPARCNQRAAHHISIAHDAPQFLWSTSRSPCRHAHPRTALTSAPGRCGPLCLSQTLLCCHCGSGHTQSSQPLLTDKSPKADSCLGSTRTRPSQPSSWPPTATPTAPSCIPSRRVAHHRTVPSCNCQRTCACYVQHTTVQVQRTVAHRIATYSQLHALT